MLRLMCKKTECGAVNIVAIVVIIVVTIVDIVVVVNSYGTKCTPRTSREHPGSIQDGPKQAQKP